MSSSGRLLSVLLCVMFCVKAADWPQYRGPNGDGNTSERIRTNWSSNPPRVVWRKPIGPGWCSMAVSGGRVFTQVRRTLANEEREVCVALDAATGDEIWATDVDGAIYTDLAGYSDQIDGPRSTPTVEGDRVYVLTSFLKLYCLRADNGGLIWKRDFVAELGAQLIPWENAASPLLVGDLIYLNANAPDHRLMAVRKSDGVTEWSGRNEGLTHASPVYGVVAGAPQVVFLTSSGLVALNPLTGAFLWNFPFNPSTTSTASSPVIVGDSVFASAAYGSGMWIARVTKTDSVFSAALVKRQQGVFYQSHWATPVAHAGKLFCNPSSNPGQQRLTCLDMETGVNQWVQQKVGTGDIGYGGIIKANDVLVVLTESGELVLVEPNISSYVEIAKFKVLTQYCWNHVALSNGRIYARNSSFDSEIVSLDVKLAAMPLPPFELSVSLVEDRAHVRILVSSKTATLLQEEHVERIEALAASDVAAPTSEWTPISASVTYSAGALLVELPIENVAQRYVRVHDKEAVAP